MLYGQYILDRKLVRRRRSQKGSSLAYKITRISLVPLKMWVVDHADNIPERSDNFRPESRLCLDSHLGPPTRPGIIQYRRISPPDPQVFTALDLSTVRQP